MTIAENSSNSLTGKNRGTHVQNNKIQLVCDWNVYRNWTNKRPSSYGPVMQMVYCWRLIEGLVFLNTRSAFLLEKLYPYKML